MKDKYTEFRQKVQTFLNENPNFDTPILSVQDDITVNNKGHGISCMIKPEYAQMPTTFGEEENVQMGLITYYEDYEELLKKNTPIGLIVTIMSEKLKSALPMYTQLSSISNLCSEINDTTIVVSQKIENIPPSYVTDVISKDIPEYNLRAYVKNAIKVLGENDEAGLYMHVGTKEFGRELTQDEWDKAVYQTLTKSQIKAMTMGNMPMLSLYDERGFAEYFYAITDEFVIRAAKQLHTDDILIVEENPYSMTAIGLVDDEKANAKLIEHFRQIQPNPVHRFNASKREYVKI